MAAIATTLSWSPSAQPSQAEPSASSACLLASGSRCGPEWVLPERGLVGPPRGSRSAAHRRRRRVAGGCSGSSSAGRGLITPIGSAAAGEYGRHLAVRSRQHFTDPHALAAGSPFRCDRISHQHFNGWSQHVAPLHRYTSTKQRTVYGAYGVISRMSKKRPHWRRM